MEIKRIDHRYVLVVKRSNVYYIVRLFPHANKINEILSILLQLYYPNHKIDKEEIKQIISCCACLLTPEEFLLECKKLYKNDKTYEGNEIRSYLSKIEEYLGIAQEQQRQETTSV